MLNTQEGRSGSAGVKRSLRVLAIISKGESGGAQTHLLELCRALAGRCHYFVLIGGSAHSELGTELRRLDVHVQHVASIGNSFSPVALLRSVRHVLHVAKAWRPDAIHLHSAAAGVVGRIAGRLAGIPVVYTMHGFGFKPAVPPLRRMIAYSAEQILAPLTRQLICVSEHERALALRLRIPAGRISVIFNGLSDCPWRAEPGAENPRLVMVARVAPPKRQDLLIEALSMLRGRGTSVPLTIMAGGGPQLERLRSTAVALGLASHVELVGDVDDIPGLLACCQVFVLLSDHEGHPISIIEAMRAGLPVVASKLPGICEQITHGREGLCVSNRPADVADAIQVLISDPRLRVRMGKAARERFEARFGVAAMADRVAAIYETLPAPAQH